MAADDNKKFIGAIDQGTTSTRFIVFDASGSIVSMHQKEHNQIYPHPGWCEHNPMEIIQNINEVVMEALKKADLTPDSLAAVGITNQRETTVLWDKNTGLPVYNAIVWHDSRTAEIVHRLENMELPNLKLEPGQNRFREKTGLPLATYFSLSKIIWILENVSGIREKCEAGDILFGNIDAWIVWTLTGGKNGGVHITDVTNASRTMLMNLKTQEWDTFLLEAFDIPKNILPDIRSSSEIYGYGSSSSCLKNVAFAGILGDQQAALVGQTCFQQGDVKNTYGTGCFIMMNTGTVPVPSKNGLLTTVGYKFGKSETVFALEGSVAVAGALVQWLRDNLQIISSAPEIEELAKKVEDNGGVYFVPAFAGLFAPYWRTDARGVIAGMTAYCTKNHIARAALEATAFQSNEVVNAMRSDWSHASSNDSNDIAISRLKVDGGMVVNETLMQFQADLVDVPVVRPKIAETTALGAAYAAGFAVGVYEDLQHLQSQWQVDKIWNRTMEDKMRTIHLKKWKKAIERTMHWEEE